MTIFILTCSSLFLFIALNRLRGAFFLYIFLLPFMPAYLAIPLGIGGAGISLRRILTYVLLLGIFIAFLRFPRKYLNALRLLMAWRVFLLGLIVLYVAKLTSTFMLNETVGLAYWFDEVAEIVTALLLGIIFIDNMQAVKTFFFVVVSSFFFCELIVLIEYAAGHNLLQNLVTIEVSTVGEEVLSGFDRGGYRTMGLFDNPLSLSEFVLTGAIFSYGTYRMKILKWVPWLAMLLTFPVIYSTGSRSGFLLLSTILVVFGYFYVVKYKPSLRLLVRLLSVFVFLGVLFLTYFAISDPHGFVRATPFLQGDATSDSSTIFRLMQYPLIFTAILDNPLFGYGVKNHLILDLNTPLDNYYLRVLIESGFIGLFAFLVYVLNVVKFVTSGVHPSQLTSAFSNHTYMIVKLYLASFIGYKFFISMNYNNIYFYLVCGMLIGLSAQRNCLRATNLPMASGIS